MTARYRTWAADPHQWGHGKVHLIDDCDEARTMCGKLMANFPGRAVIGVPASCKACAEVPARRQQRAEQEERCTREAAERQRIREEENDKWWTFYNDYLQTPEWFGRRSAVLERARGICEGCLTRKAMQVHHLTYAHVGAEFLWELRAICNECHDRIHSRKVAA